jgi:hypothetical protein
MALAGSGHLANPSAMGQTMADAKAYGIDPRPEAAEIALRLQSNNASAIRTTVSTQVDTLVITIKKGSHKPVPPHPYRTASGAALRPRPFKISTLATNLIEND